MHSTIRNFTLIASALALAACGATDEGADNADAAGGADTAAAPAAPAAPGLDGRKQIIADFQAANQNHCPFYKTDGGSTDDGDFAGSTLTLCSGMLSQMANHGMVMLNEDGVNFPAGTFFVTLGGNARAMGDFEPLFDTLFELAGITEAYEKEQFRSEVSRWLFSAGNIRTIEWEPVMTTESGVRIRAQTYQFGTGGKPTFRFDPAR